jgi:hypothetical protein
MGKLRERDPLQKTEGVGHPHPREWKLFGVVVEDRDFEVALTSEVERIFMRLKTTTGPKGLGLGPGTRP